MEIPKEILDHMLSTNTALGRIEAGQDKTLEYLNAVNANTKEVKKDLIEHKLDNEAHGKKAEGKVSAALIAWSGLAVALMTFVLSFLKLK